jgi:mRNA-degrading endonuclease RelE of RelBE toxin-antitoxin system
MPWAVEITGPAERDLDRVSGRDRSAIERALGRVAADPGGADLKKLGGRVDEWRLRVGRWRAILRLDTRSGTITVLRVLRRTEGTYRR